MSQPIVASVDEKTGQGARPDTPTDSGSTPPLRPMKSDGPGAAKDEAFDLLGAMMVAARAAGLVALGLELDLYRVMAGRGPLTSVEVADRASSMSGGSASGFTRSPPRVSSATPAMPASK